MATFAYTARDANGAAVSGTLDADSQLDAVRQLRQEGKYPTSVTAGAGESLSPAATATGGVSGIKISRAEVIQFATQLSIMIETGVTLSESLDCIAQQAEKPAVKAIIGDLSQQVQAGTDFSTALARHPRSFPRIFVALMRAAEKSGMMGKLLNRATTYLRDEQETIRKVRGAMTYPGIMLAFSVTTTIFLLAFVLPKFTSLYSAKAAALPVPTRVLMNLSEFLVGNWIAIVAAVLTTSIGGYFYVRTPGGARVWHLLQLRIPLMGGMFRKLHLSRGLRMVGTLAGAGVNLVDCVRTAQDLCDNTIFRGLWDQVSEQIQIGRQFSEPLFSSTLVPRSVAQMLSSAEKSGKLAQVMEQVAGYAEQELKEKIAEMTRYIEPAMIVIMGVIIGGVSMALLLPIFTISRVMSQ